MKVWMIGLVCLFILGAPFSARADSKTITIESLIDIANKIYQATSNDKIEMAIDDLNTFKKTWEQVSVTHDDLSPVANRTISASEDKLMKALSVNYSQQEIEDASVEFRLAVDALVNSQHPLWLGMKDKVIGAFNKLNNDVTNDDDRAFQVDLNHFIDLYQMVYPSMTIDIKPSVLKDLDSKITHLINNRMTIVQDRSSHTSHLNDIQNQLNHLFNDVEETSGLVTSPSLFMPLLLIGGLIIFTLLYVTWRKYKGEDKSNRHMTVTK